MNKITKTLLASTCLAIASSEAAILSVNLTDGGNGFGNADITELAGVVEAGGWETADSNGARNDTNLSALRVDDNGTLVTTTATMTIGAGFGGYFQNGSPASGFNTATALFSNNMMANFMEFNSAKTIEFSNLNASVGATYDLYIYMDRYFGNTGTASITVGGVTKFIEGEDNTGPFSEADYSTAAAAQVSPSTGGNYVLFEGLTSNSLNIALGSAAAGNNGINGIQIVQVPEPSSMALLGLSGLGLLLRRRK